MEKMHLFADCIRHRTGSCYISHVLIDDKGVSVNFMERQGYAMARTYWTEEAEGIVVFDSLSVEESRRKKGIATGLLKSHIKAVREYGLKSMLWVEIGTWQHDWLKRMGYQDELKYAIKKGNVWMSLT